MNSKELDQLLSPEVSEWIANHIDGNPHELALRGAITGFPIALACQQIALLQKAKHKLPTWAKTQCILPKRAFEQCSSEAVAMAKPWGIGKNALDLTCGLGVDSYAIASHYEMVTSLEPNSELASVVELNAKRLGVNNIEVINQTAEHFIKHYNGPTFDLIYLDPDRRDDSGKRAFALEDCKPNVLEILPQLRKLGKRILLKTSPMLDIKALQSALGGKCMIWVLSEGNECKELLALITEDIHEPKTGAIFLRKGSFAQFEELEQFKTPTFAPIGQFLYEADIALYKAELAVQWFQSQPEFQTGGMSSKQGYFSSEFDFPEFHGHRFKTIEIYPWKPTEIKKDLKSRGIKQIQISRRAFDLPMEAIRKQLNIKEGGKFYLLLTQVEGQGRTAILAERLS